MMSYNDISGAPGHNSAIKEEENESEQTLRYEQTGDNG